VYRIRKVEHKREENCQGNDERAIRVLLLQQCDARLADALKSHNTLLGKRHIEVRLIPLPTHVSAKFTILGYIGTYYAIGAALPLSVTNYFLVRLISLQNCYLIL